MEKQALREQIWDELEETGLARFPFPPHGRIPNFDGSDTAADRLADLDSWRDAAAIKANPDAPQLPARRQALREGKTVYVAVPRLRNSRCFLELDPAALHEAGVDTDDAATIGGADEHGVPVYPEELPAVDLLLAGSVAVTDDGRRVGKGEGYSDLEFALLREFGLVDDETTTVTTVHEVQVVDADVPTGAHDVPLDVVVTPERTIETGAGGKPTGIDWAELSEERIAEIPILERLRA